MHKMLKKTVAIILALILLLALAAPAFAEDEDDTPPLEPSAAGTITIPGFMKAIKKITDIAMDIAIIIGVLSVAFCGLKMFTGGKIEDVKAVLKTCIFSVILLMVIPNIVVFAISIAKPYSWDPTLGIREVIEYTNGLIP